tara:strand:- start:90 stop:797 length:708 start_codon:yes stop_codon:yes gene_type:complete
MSGGVDIVVPWFEAMKAPLVDGVVTMDGFGVRFTPQGSGQVWAVVGNFSHNNTTPNCDEVRGRLGVAEHALSDPNQCQIESRTQGGAESIHRLSRCGLESGALYTVFVCISAEGSEAVDDSLTVRVPLSPSNYFERDVVLVSDLYPRSTVAVTHTALSTGEAWAAVVPEDHDVPSIESMKSGAYLLARRRLLTSQAEQGRSDPAGVVDEVPDAVADVAREFSRLRGEMEERKKMK